MKNKHLVLIEKDLKSQIDKLNSHPIYSKINTIEGLQIFMEHHVYASWDSMSLLKNLQKSLSSNTIYWINSEYRVATRYINELMLEEESDFGPDKNPISHFELYLESMLEVGASTVEIKEFLNVIGTGIGIKQSIEKLRLQKHIADFLNTTFNIIKSNSSVRVASSIYFARENLIPVIFPGFLKSLENIDIENYKIFKFYLDRHIYLDSDFHSKLARKTLISLCGDDEKKWEDARVSAFESIKARVDLWDGILKKLDAKF